MHSARYDDLNPFILDDHLDQLALLLTEICNCSFATGIVPQSLKMTKITLIFNQGSRTYSFQLSTNISFIIFCKTNGKNNV